MPEDAVAYLLLALDLLVVALVLSAPFLLLIWLLGRSARKQQTGEPVLRRCASCQVAWKGVPGHNISKTGLRLRRRVRRRTRAKEKNTPAWARRQGWNRCPSCLSKQVRTSSRASAQQASAQGSSPQR